MNLPFGDLEEAAARVMAKGGETLRGRRVLITGASGFFGRWLAETFCRMNAKWGLEARLGLLTRSAAGLGTSAPHIVNDPAVTVLEGDLHALVRGRTEPSWTSCDHVIHGATETSETLAREHPRVALETVRGVHDALDFAVRSGARRFLYLSSGAVYGRQPPGISRLPEDFAGAPDVLDPASAYAETKRMGELLCASIARHSSLEIVIARGFAFVGPGLPLDRGFAAGNFLRNVLEGNPVEVRGDGTPVRSFLYAGDLASWLWTLLLEGRPGRAYNVGSESEITIAGLAREIASLATPPVEVRVAGVPDPARPAERYVPSTERARSELGLEETVDRVSALRKTLDWYREALRPAPARSSA